MSQFTFRGFPVGSEVSLSVAQGATSASGSVAAWSLDVGTAQISTIAPSNMAAPAGVWFDAVNESGFEGLTPTPAGTPWEAEHHELIHEWRVAGAPLAPWTAPQNLVTGWADPNRAEGRRVAFFFPDAGTYTVELYVYPLNGVRPSQPTATETVQIEDPDDVFPGIRTIVYSETGDFAGAPSGALQATSNAGLKGLLDAAFGSIPPRVLFRAGSDQEIQIDLRDSALAYLGKYGTGANPILRNVRDAKCFEFWRNTEGNDFTVSDIDFRGNWDSVTETGIRNGGPIEVGLREAEVHQTFWNCQFSGWGALYPDAGATTDTRSDTFIGNCTITNWQDFGIFFGRNSAANTHFALRGSCVAQHVDALGGGPKFRFSNTHGPLRIEQITHTYIDQTDFFSRTGWSADNPALADQPCIRLNSFVDGVNNTGTINRVVCEGGFQLLQIGAANASVDCAPGNYLVDKVLLLATAKSSKFAEHSFGGITKRNVLCVFPDVPYWSGADWRAAFTYNPLNNNVPANADTPQRIYHCSVLSLMSGTNDDGGIFTFELVREIGSQTFGDFDQPNNIVHAPFHDTVVDGDGPFTLTETIPGVTPRFRGIRYNFENEIGTLGGSVANNAGVTVPYPSGTNQAYWQAIEATDTRHALEVSGDRYYASEGEFEVSYDAGGVRLTNRTGVTWNSGSNWVLALERTTMIPPMDTTYESPATIAFPRPVADSASDNNADVNLRAHDDFFGVLRPSVENDERGAVLTV